MDLIYASTMGRMGNGDRIMATIKGQSKAVSEGERNEDDGNDFRDFDVISLQIANLSFGLL